MRRSLADIGLMLHNRPNGCLRDFDFIKQYIKWRFREELTSADSLKCVEVNTEWREMSKSAFRATQWIIKLQVHAIPSACANRSDAQYIPFSGCCKAGGA
jgi:hypothetical protein